MAGLAAAAVGGAVLLSKQAQPRPPKIVSLQVVLLDNKTSDFIEEGNITADNLDLPGELPISFQRIEKVYIAQLPAGRYRITATALGFIAAESTITIQTSTQITMRLNPTTEPLFQAAFRVFEPTGNPAPQTTVTITEKGAALTSGNTGTEGTISFNLPAGEYLVIIQKTGFVNQDFSFTITNSGVAFDLQLQSSTLQVGDISVSLIDALTNVPILFATVQSGGLTASVEGPNGIYLFNNVPIGSYLITASAPGYNPGTGNAQLLRSGDVTSIRIPLTPSTTVATNAIQISDATIKSPTGGFGPFPLGGTVVPEATYKNLTNAPIAVLLAVQPVQPDGTVVPTLFAQVAINPGATFTFKPSLNVTVQGTWIIEFSAFTDLPSAGGRPLTASTTITFAVI